MEELSMEKETLWSLFNVDFVPIKRSSVLLQFNSRKFELNQAFISRRQLVRDKGGSVELGLVER